MMDAESIQYRIESVQTRDSPLKRACSMTITVTINDVAKAAGVSRSAVSMVLSGNRSDEFSETTRRRIHAAAEKLGYRPNLVARSTRMQRSHLVGVLFYGANTNLAADFLAGVQGKLIDAKCAPLVFSHASLCDEAKCLESCLDCHVSGLIVNMAVNTLGRTNAAKYHALRENELPLVEVFGRFIAGVPQMNVNNVAAARKSVQHLLGLGHRRIAMLDPRALCRGPQQRGGNALRRLGAILRLRRRCVRRRTRAHCAHAPGLGRRGRGPAVRRWRDRRLRRAVLKHPAKPTAVICYNDLEAYGVIRAARLRSIALPDRLSLIGFGDLGLSRIVMPALTTVPVPAYEVGGRAAEALLKCPDEQPAESTLIEPEIVVRESTTHVNP